MLKKLSFYRGLVCTKQSGPTRMRRRHQPNSNALWTQTHRVNTPTPQPPRSRSKHHHIGRTLLAHLRLSLRLPLPFFKRCHLQRPTTHASPCGQTCLPPKCPPKILLQPSVAFNSVLLGETKVIVSRPCTIHLWASSNRRIFLCNPQQMSIPLATTPFRVSDE